MEPLQNFAFEQYDPKRFEAFLKGLKAPIGQEDNQRITDILLNPTSFLLTPASPKGMITMLTNEKGEYFIPAYTTLNEAMKNIHFDPNCKMFPCSVAMYASMMEKDPKIAGVSLNFVEIPGKVSSGMVLSRQNILDMKEPYVRINKAYQEISKNAKLAPVSLYAPDEVMLSQVRVSIGAVLQQHSEVESCNVALSRRTIDEKESRGIFYVLSGAFQEEGLKALKEEMTTASRSFIPQEWVVEISTSDNELGRKVLPGTQRFY